MTLVVELQGRIVLYRSPVCELCQACRSVGFHCRSDVVADLTPVSPGAVLAAFANSAFVYDCAACDWGEWMGIGIMRFIDVLVNYYNKYKLKYCNFNSTVYIILIGIVE